MATLRAENVDVFYVEDAVPLVGRADMKKLIAKAHASPRQRSRICVHRGAQDKIQEMLIVLAKGTYVRPHKHPGKTESYHVIDGTADLAIFGDSGRLEEVIPMGKEASGLMFYCRVPTEKYHAFLVTSDVFVFHETTNGPFDQDHNLWASWYPDP